MAQHNDIEPQAASDAPVQRNQQDIRAHNQTVILAAAEEEFVLQGFRGATMQGIADRAELPKANVHYYFKNKKICTKQCCILLFKSGTMAWSL